jgi:hypothetical protein
MRTRTKAERVRSRPNSAQNMLAKLVTVPSFANAKKIAKTVRNLGVAAERPTIVTLLAAMSICNLSLKNWYEAFAMARCLP